MSIALLEGGDPILGVVHHPLGDPRRRRGPGCSPAPGDDIGAIPPVVAIAAPYGGHKSARRAREALEPNCGRVMEMWSPARDWVSMARGRIDAIVCLGAEAEDKMAGIRIALESGCSFRLLDELHEARPFTLGSLGQGVSWLAAATDHEFLTRVLDPLRQAA